MDFAHYYFAVVGTISGISGILILCSPKALHQIRKIADKDVFRGRVFTSPRCQSPKAARGSISEKLEYLELNLNQKISWEDGWLAKNRIGFGISLIGCSVLFAIAFFL